MQIATVIKALLVGVGVVKSMGIDAQLYKSVSQLEDLLTNK